MQEKKPPTLDESIIHRLTLGYRLTLGDPNGPHLDLSADGFYLWSGPLTLRASLNLDRGMPKFTLYDGNSRERVSLEIDSEGWTDLACTDGNGTQRLSCGIDGDGDPSLVMNDIKGDRCFRVEASRNCAPTLEFYDTEGQPRVSFFIDPEEMALVMRDDDDNKELWRTPTKPEAAETAPAEEEEKQEA
jgi:hypothetical protein